MFIFNEIFIITIVLYLIILLIITSINIFLCKILFSIYKYQNEYIRKENISDNNTTILKQSTIILDHTRDIITQIAILTFQKFEDEHEMDKVTRENIKNIASEIAIKAKQSIKFDKISFDKLSFDQEFYESYLVAYSIYITKNLLVKSVDNI